MFKKMYEAFSKNSWYIDYPIIVIGCVIYALGFSIFLIPNHISPGGVSGVAVILNHLMPFITTGTLIIILNIPLFLPVCIPIQQKHFCQTLKSLLLCTSFRSFIDQDVTKQTGEMYAKCCIEHNCWH